MMLRRLVGFLAGHQIRVAQTFLRKTAITALDGLIWIGSIVWRFRSTEKETSKTEGSG